MLFAEVQGKKKEKKKENESGVLTPSLIIPKDFPIKE